MEFAVNIPLFSIILCLLCAVISSLLRAKTAWRVSMTLCAVIAAGSVLLLCYGSRTGMNTEYQMGHYPHPWGNMLRFGILEPLLSGVFALVILLSILGGRKQQEADLSPGKGNFYYIMCDLALCALLSLAYTDDIFTGYVFIEISTLAACGLLMIREIGRTTLAAVRYMIFSLVGSGLFLLGVILLYAITGHLLMPELGESIAALAKSGAHHTVLITAIALITIGLSIKSGMFPFHFWMPDTYGYATPASGSILSGVISKGYIFFLIKLIFRVFGRDLFYGTGMNGVLYLLGAAGVIVGSVSAAREKEVFRMVAYSSAAQIGYIFMGIGISPEAGCVAALFHILTHAATKPMLFLASAQISDGACGAGNEAGHLRENWRGMGYICPMAGVAFTVGALSMIGIPLTMGFVSKYRFAEAAFSRTEILIPTLIVLAVSTVLNGFYFGRVVIQLYALPHKPGKKPESSAERSYYISAAVLLAVNLVTGVAASPLIRLLEKGITLISEAL